MAMKPELFDPESLPQEPLRADYREYRLNRRRNENKKKERLSRGNKIFLIDLAVIALFGMMIFLFRPYLISPNRLGDFTFSATASALEDGWVRVIVTAKPVKETAETEPPVLTLALFYDGIEWFLPDFLNQTERIPTENGWQWIFLPFPEGETSKIAVSIQNEEKSVDFIIDIHD